VLAYPNHLKKFGIGPFLKRSPKLKKLNISTLLEFGRMASFMIFGVLAVL
jgi:hypothetical protein